MIRAAPNNHRAGKLEFKIDSSMSSASNLNLSLNMGHHAAKMHQWPLDNSSAGAMGFATY